MLSTFWFQLPTLHPYILEEAFTLAPRYSNDLLAMRWTQRTLYHNNKLQEVRMGVEEEDYVVRVTRDHLNPSSLESTRLRLTRMA